MSDTAAAVESWCSDRFVVCSDATGDDAVDDGRRIYILEPISGWTMVLWPGYFTPYIHAAEHLSKTLGTVVWAISDCWQQVTIDWGTIVDQNATDPRYLTSDLEPLDVVAPRWQGDPELVAALLGCRARDVARHYRRNRRSRSFDDWGFVDLWAVEGITYADHSSSAVGATFVLGEDWFEMVNRVLGY